MRYRIHYGNGQVGETRNTKKAAQQERHEAVLRRDQYANMIRIMFEDSDTGEWFFCSN